MLANAASPPSGLGTTDSDSEGSWVSASTVPEDNNRGHRKGNQQSLNRPGSKEDDSKVREHKHEGRASKPLDRAHQDATKQPEAVPVHVDIELTELRHAEHGVSIMSVGTSNLEGLNIVRTGSGEGSKSREATSESADKREGDQKVEAANSDEKERGENIVGRREKGKGKAREI